MHRSLTRSVSAALFAGLLGCSSVDPRADRAIAGRISDARPGIAVVAAGGIDGWEHVTLLDSATARYVTVTRRACESRCAPLDSATGTLAARDVARIYAIADSEPTLLRRMKGRCAEDCSEAAVTTAVFGNRRRTVVRSDREASPEVLGRVHVALAEAIRAARAPAGSADALFVQP